MSDGPIQIVLNPERFREQRLPAKGGGPAKDFFRGDNAGFEVHRAALASSVAVAAGDVTDDHYLNLLVQMRPDAFAKSHRPLAISSLVAGPVMSAHLATVR